MSRHARRYTTYRASTESVDLAPEMLRRHTVTRPKWVRVGTRAFPFTEAWEYYGTALAADSTLSLRPIPKES